MGCFCLSPSASKPSVELLGHLKRCAETQTDIWRAYLCVYALCAWTHVVFSRKVSMIPFLLHLCSLLNHFLLSACLNFNHFLSVRLLGALLNSPVSYWASSESSWRPVQPSRVRSGSPRRHGQEPHSPRQHCPPPPHWAAPELKWCSEAKDTAGKLT